MANNSVKMQLNARFLETTEVLQMSRDNVAYFDFKTSKSLKISNTVSYGKSFSLSPQEQRSKQTEQTYSSFTEVHFKILL